MTEKQTTLIRGKSMSGTLFWYISVNVVFKTKAALHFGGKLIFFSKSNEEIYM